MTVFSLYIYETIIYIKMHAPDNINYINNHATHSYSTRNKGKYINPKHRLQLYEKKTTYAGRKFFNELPKGIKEISNINTLKKKLKNYLLDASLYSLDEFWEITKANK